MLGSNMKEYLNTVNKAFGTDKTNKDYNEGILKVEDVLLFGYATTSITRQNGSIKNIVGKVAGFVVKNVGKKPVEIEQELPNDDVSTVIKSKVIKPGEKTIINRTAAKSIANNKIQLEGLKILGKNDPRVILYGDTEEDLIARGIRIEETDKSRRVVGIKKKYAKYIPMNDFIKDNIEKSNDMIQNPLFLDKVLVLSKYTNAINEDTAVIIGYAIINRSVVNMQIDQRDGKGQLERYILKPGDRLTIHRETLVYLKRMGYGISNATIVKKPNDLPFLRMKVETASLYDLRRCLNVAKIVDQKVVGVEDFVKMCIPKELYEEYIVKEKGSYGDIDTTKYPLAVKEVYVVSSKGKDWKDDKSLKTIGYLLKVIGNEPLKLELRARDGDVMKTNSWRGTAFVHREAIDFLDKQGYKLANATIVRQENGLPYIKLNDMSIHDTKICQNVAIVQNGKIVGLDGSIEYLMPDDLWK